MTGRIAVAVMMCLMPGSMLWGDDTQAVQIRELTEKVQKLEDRVKQLEQLLRPTQDAERAKGRAASLRPKFEARIAQDQKTYNAIERQEIESLYQVANRQFNTPEAQESLKKLIEKYSQANRTGCALLYLGQMSSGDEKEQYLTRAIKDFGDCWYGDGVQVASYARFHLAAHYQQTGKTAEATTLLDTIRKEYPDAIDHKGILLTELMPK
ncbi:MAG: hypothetical protein Q8K78_12765 [Planctomycetaceae bacterium]|nr:hypothetical protein [Planctomycetaceae bacterium]